MYYVTHRVVLALTNSLSIKKFIETDSCIVVEHVKIRTGVKLSKKNADLI